MNKREAYKIVHVYPDKVMEFEHHIGCVTYRGTFTKLDNDNYAPFYIEIVGEIIRDDGVKTGNISCRETDIQSALVRLWNGFNANAMVKNKYHSLEDILFL